MFQVFAAEGIGDQMFLVKPFAEIDEFASARAEGAVLAREPFTQFPACWATDVSFHAHRRESDPLSFCGGFLDLSRGLFQIGCNGCGGRFGNADRGENGLSVGHNVSHLCGG